jgi:hypothetical protein
VRKLNTTVEASPVVFNDVKRKKKDELTRGSQTTRESKKDRKDLYMNYMNPIYDETYMGGYRTSFNTILERGVRILERGVRILERGVRILERGVRILEG